MQFLSEVIYKNTFFDAVAKNNITEVKKYLKEDPKVVNHFEEDFLRSVLMFSLGKGFVEISKLLIDSGANVDYITPANAGSKVGKNASKETVLAWACNCPKNAPLLDEILAKSKVDINFKNINGLTALMIASTVGFAIAVKKLIAAGADINAKNSYEHNSVTKAIQGHPKAEFPATDKDYLAVIKTLIGAGIDMSVVTKSKDYAGMSLIQLAIEKRENSLDIVKLVIEGTAKQLGADVALNHIDAKKETALDMAISKGSSELVELLIDSGSDINNIDKKTKINRTLQKAIDAEDVGLIQTLITKGVEYTPEMQAKVDKDSNIAQEVKSALDDYLAMKNSYFFSD